MSCDDELPVAYFFCYVTFFYEAVADRLAYIAALVMVLNHVA